MEVKKTKIEIARTGVYFSAGDESAKNQWFCCHGYGQLADNMIRKFDRRIDIGDKVVCVEAPNRFYWKGVTGDPVTTWMTKRYRLDEIADNNAYLSKVYESEVSNESKNVLFGFSQGGTTIWRWIHAVRPEFDVFINYAGWIPEDVDLSGLGEYMIGKKLIFVYGRKDQYLTNDRVNALRGVIDDSRLDIEMVEVDGDHRINRDVIDSIVESAF